MSEFTRGAMCAMVAVIGGCVGLMAFSLINALFQDWIEERRNKRKQKNV